jgi:hypothetical protein
MDESTGSPPQLAGNTSYEHDDHPNIMSGSRTNLVPHPHHEGKEKVSLRKELERIFQRNDQKKHTKAPAAHSIEAIQRQRSIKKI